MNLRNVRNIILLLCTGTYLIIPISYYSQTDDIFLKYLIIISGIGIFISFYKIYMWYHYLSIDISSIIYYDDDLTKNKYKKLIQILIKKLFL